MSKTKYSKYHKKSAPCLASIQFDSLFRDNSNRPSAAKSTGTVGKWGTTSFTSIRNTDSNGKVTGESRYSIHTKRKRPSYAAPVEETSFSYNAISSKASAGVDSVKPRKFFKSRNGDQSGSGAANSDTRHKSHSRQAESIADNGYSSFQRPKRTAKKVFSSGNTRTRHSLRISSKNEKPSIALIPHNENSSEPLEYSDSAISSDNYKSSSKHTGVENNPEKKPPIKLRIFKDKITSNFISETKLEKTVISKSKRKHKRSSTSVDLKIRIPSALSAVQHEVNSTITDAYLPNVQTTSSDIDDTQSTSTDLQIPSYPTTINLVKPIPSSSPPLSSVEHESNQTSESIADIEKYIQSQVQSEVSHNSNNKISSECVLDLSQNSENNFSSCTLNSDIKQSLVETDSEASTPKPLDLRTSCGENKIEPIITEEEWQPSVIEGIVASLGNEVKASTQVIETEVSQDLKDSHGDSKLSEYPESEEINSQEDKGQIENSTVYQGNNSKRGSIFKSRALSNTKGPKKRLALYRHKWHDDDKDKLTTTPKPDEYGSTFNEEGPVQRITRSSTYASRKQLVVPEPEKKVGSNKKGKQFYTVVRNVKKAHQIQESGEFQEFNDDVEYILDALQNNNPLSTRCLSAVTLASKCMIPAFRMHLRAHGTVAKFFHALSDAPTDPSLALCTATVMFVLSQDRLNMDVDRDSLELMLNLLDADTEQTDATVIQEIDEVCPEFKKSKQRVREMCQEIKEKGHAKHLHLDNINAGHLAMETLLSLTCARAGEWFKEELRSLGGLDHLVQTVSQCVTCLAENIQHWTDLLLDKIRKVDRCLKVLENITRQNEENQNYLLCYKEGILLDVLIKLFKICDHEITINPVPDSNDKLSSGVVITDTLLTTMKVLINLAHNYHSESCGSAIAGQKEGMIDTTLHCLLCVPAFIPEENRFDVLVLAMCLLINLVEHNVANRLLLLQTKAPCSPFQMPQVESRPNALEALITLFYEKEEHARLEEAKADDILEQKKEEIEPDTEAGSQKTDKTQVEVIEETLEMLLQKAGRHMEDTMIAAYIALLLGYFIMNDTNYLQEIQNMLPENSFVTIIAVLKKFHKFMKLTPCSVGSSRGVQATERVIKFMENCTKQIPTKSGEEIGTDSVS